MTSTPPGHRSADRFFLAGSAFLFAGSAAGTIYFCSTMSGGMVMPGGWTMSMMWMKMPAQTWASSATSFLGVWTLMMLAMMLPSLVPMLLGYRRCIRATNRRLLGVLTAVCAAAYFFVWAAFGAVVYTLGVILAQAEMHWPAFARAVPLLVGVALLLAGCIQLTPWKSRQLVLCRLAPAGVGSAAERIRDAWRHGFHLGVRCALCCSGFMITLLVVGAMNLRAMVILAAALTAERFVSRSAIVARAAGVAIVLVGALTIALAIRTA